MDKLKQAFNTFTASLADLPNKLLGLAESGIKTINEHMSKPVKMILVLVLAAVAFEVAVSGSSKVVTFLVNTFGQLVTHAEKGGLNSIAMFVVVVLLVKEIKKP